MKWSFITVFKGSVKSTFSSSTRTIQTELLTRQGLSSFGENEFKVVILDEELRDTDLETGDSFRGLEKRHSDFERTYTRATASNYRI